METLSSSISIKQIEFVVKIFTQRKLHTQKSPLVVNPKHLIGFHGSSDGKNLLAMGETWVQTLGWEDPPEKGTAVFLPGEFHRQRSLAGYRPWGHKESDATQ